MPQILLEYSSNLEQPSDMASVIKKLHEVLPTIGPFETNALKSRVLEHNVFRVGNGSATNAFVHLQLGILSGRTETVRRDVSNALLDFLKIEFGKSIANQPLSLTVEVREMDAICYAKESTI